MPVPTISIQYIRHVITTVMESGAELDPLLEELRLPARIFNDPNARLPYGEHRRLLRETTRFSGDPALGLHAGETLRMGSYGVVGYLGMHCDTLREALQALMDFSPLLLEGSTYSLKKRARGVHFRKEQTHADSGAEPPGIELALAGRLSYVRGIVSRPLDPLAVRLAFDAPNYREEYARIFRCPVSFRQPENALIFSPAQLALPLRFSNPRLRKVFQSLAEEELERHARQDDLVFQVREILIAGANVKESKLVHVARRLAMSERTLQRRLKEAGTTFARIVDKAHREVCLSLIRERRLTLEEIAYHCGCASSGALVRVVRRWTGMTPSAYRAAAQDGPAAPAKALVSPGNGFMRLDVGEGLSIL